MSEKKQKKQKKQRQRKKPYKPTYDYIFIGAWIGEPGHGKMLIDLDACAWYKNQWDGGGSD